MGLLEPYVLNLNRIKDDIPKIAGKIVEKRAEDIVNLVRYSQLGVGLDSDGNALAYPGKSADRRPLYEPSTENYWAKINPPIKDKTTDRRYNFEWTGDTFRTMILELRGEGGFEIFTKDGKQTLLEQIYGEIFTLTETHNTFVNETMIIPDLYKYVFDNMLSV